MQDNKPKILIISSASPLVGPGVLSANYYDAYRSQGYDVDLLTLNKCKDRPEFLYLQDSASLMCRIKNKIKFHNKRLYRVAWSILHNCLRYPKPGHFFFYFKEDNPPVSTKKVLAKVTKPYDMVHVLFWQEMLSFETVLAIYRKLKCFFVFDCVDYSTMSGGCHFSGDCERYKTGCGCCPAYDSKDPHDFTWFNINYRKKVYDEVNPLVTGNSYMISFYDQSVLLKGRPRIISYPIIDLNAFRPLDKVKLHEQYGIPEQKTFKILFGCQSIDDERKGIKYLIEAINIFTAELTDSELSHVLVMAIGKNFDVVRQQLNSVDTHDFGFVSINELPSIYSFADVFLCPSVNDAGPMMVNQSLCCGTPVVGFEMGACLDAVKDRGTGYCAKLRDSHNFANCIEKIYRQTPEEREVMRNKCIEHAQKSYSYDAAVKHMIEAYNKYGKR